MRQLGTLSSERDARRFAAWLVAQRIEAHAEQESAGWVVWVRDEDQLPQAREALAHFREHPDDPKYQGAEKTAETLQREEETRRKHALGNVVEMRGRWGAGVPGMGGVKRKAPLVMVLIGLSALVALLTSNDTMSEGEERGPPGEILRSLLFVDPADAFDADGTLDMWASVRRGQVWRLITPIFIHYGLIHIVFNMLMLYSFGAQIEDRRKTMYMLLLVLALAALSNGGQATEAMLRDRASSFGGMSGVVYGLFGYLFIKNRFDSRDRYFLSPSTTFIALLWLALCILSDVPPFSSFLKGPIGNIANSAHVVGLIAGATIAYAPLLVRKPA
jgi:GlpG protein